MASIDHTFTIGMVAVGQLSAVSLILSTTTTDLCAN